MSSFVHSYCMLDRQQRNKAASKVHTMTDSRPTNKSNKWENCMLRAKMSSPLWNTCSHHWLCRCLRDHFELTPLHHLLVFSSIFFYVIYHLQTTNTSLKLNCYSFIYIDKLTRLRSSMASMSMLAPCLTLLFLKNVSDSCFTFTNHSVH